MKRDAIVVFVGCWVLALGWLSTLAMSDDTAKHPAAATSAAATSTAATSATANSTAATSASAAVPDSPPGADAGAGATDDDGDAKPANDTTPPPLPELGEGPKSVRFGVIIVRHRGAQATSPKARTKADALAKAKEILPLAKEDFAEAVKKGDSGSVENPGKIFRGILEKRIEYALFSLEKGEVSDIIATPRGFWIVRRRK